MTLRLASYNIRKAVGLDRRRHPERILAVLNEIGADVVLLQEADQRLGPRPTAIPRFLIEQETDFQIADLARTDVSLGWHGNAVLVRRGLDIEAPRHFELPGLEPRGAVMVTVSGLGIVGTHLGLIRRWRLRQMRAILDHLGEGVDCAVVAGDFNEWSRDRGFDPWDGKLSVVTPGPSFHAGRPVAPLDRLAHGRRIRITETGVIRHGAALVASDHLPVWADLELAEASHAPGDPAGARLPKADDGR